MNCPTCAPSSSMQTAIALRVHGADVPMEGLISQGGMREDVDTTWAEADIAAPEKQAAASKPTLARLISSVWTAAPSYRGSDKRRGGNGARIRLLPPSHGEVDVLMAAGTP